MVWSWVVAVAGFLLCLWMPHVYDALGRITGSEHVFAKAEIVPYVVTPYLVLMVAYGIPPLAHRLLQDRDLSYGIYIYAFPVQQTIIHLWPSVTPLQIIAVALPITLVLAAASWFLIERPALRSKPKVLAWQRDLASSWRARHELPAR